MGIFDYISQMLATQVPVNKDPKITRALWQMNKQPTVPIQVVNEGDQFPVGKNVYTASKLRGVGGFVLPEKDKIYVPNFLPSYEKDDSKRIAAMLAHEQRHVEGANEVDAYTTELENLKRLNYPDKKALRDTEERIKAEREMLLWELKRKPKGTNSKTDSPSTDLQVKRK